MISQRLLSVIALAAILLAAQGCGPEQQTATPEPAITYDTTIGGLGQFYQYSAVPVRGFGIVVGLRGTGSSECPPHLRQLLSKHIIANTGESRIRPDDLINRLDTAVVEIFGTIPQIASRGERFDLKVVAFPGTQTTSLSGGTLYSTDLKAAAGLVSYEQFAPVLAKAAGPIYVDTIDPKDPPTTGYILGGGTATEGVRLAIALNNPNYTVAAAVRNRINERFGPKIAKAASPGEVEFFIPERYSEQKERFLALLSHLYMAEDFDLRARRIETLVQRLASDPDPTPAEHALDAIGRPALEKIAPLLESNDPKVRFHAARCMLSIGDDRALSVLQAFVADRNSPHRLPSINAIGLNAKRETAVAILSRLLGDQDFTVRFAAYERLLRLQDVSVSRRLVSGKFFMDQVAHKGPPVIYLSRARVPRIVIFGAPIACEKDMFIESDQRDIVLNTPPGSGHVEIMRRLPNRPRLVGPLAADYDISDIIRTLCEEPETNNLQLRRGLGASYSDMAGIVAKLVRENMVKATLVTGDMTTAGTFLQQTEAAAR